MTTRQPIKKTSVVTKLEHARSMEMTVKVMKENKELRQKLVDAKRSQKELNREIRHRAHENDYELELLEMHKDILDERSQEQDKKEESLKNWEWSLECQSKKLDEKQEDLAHWELDLENKEIEQKAEAFADGCLKEEKEKKEEKKKQEKEEGEIDLEERDLSDFDKGILENEVHLLGQSRNADQVKKILESRWMERLKSTPESEKTHGSVCAYIDRLCKCLQRDQNAKLLEIFNVENATRLASTHSHAQIKHYLKFVAESVNISLSRPPCKQDLEFLGNSVPLHLKPMAIMFINKWGEMFIDQRS